ncbi:protein CASC10-like [Suricata suricatta]|uniref:protein CASC10-like n=1 Tax=Suricata suricatta TaxID=37032 RepID=UPI001155CC08|nr:protein CASC10-like [Suricata suricatta]
MPGQSCLNLDSGLREAVHAWAAQPRPPTSALSLLPQLPFPCIPALWLHLATPWPNVPTPSGDRGPRAVRLAARRGAGGTAGQQRLLQVPGASAAAVQRGLLRWNQLGSPPALSALPPP